MLKNIDQIALRNLLCNKLKPKSNIKAKHGNTYIILSKTFMTDIVR